MMKLTKEDFESYKEQQISNLKVALMSQWAHEIILKALDEKLKKTKK